MAWSIEYYSTNVEKSILELPAGLLARYLRLTDLILEFGANLGMPHTRIIGKGLFELRVKSKEGIVRAFFCTKTAKKIVMLHMFVKKSQKTPNKEIKIAFERMKEVISNDT